MDFKSDTGGFDWLVCKTLYGLDAVTRPDLWSNQILLFDCFLVSSSTNLACATETDIPSYISSHFCKSSGNHKDKAFSS